MESQNLNQLRHSTAHLLAAALIRLYPDVKIAIGPSIENGFYYDAQFSKPITDSDLPGIEKEMAKILPDWSEFTSREVTESEAREFYKDNPFKLDLIDEIVKKGEPITMYKVGDFDDLCRGGHSENPSKDIGAFKLLSVAGAYWRGDENKPMLTRIYGTAFKTKDELDQHLIMLEEAKKRDHKKLGRELDLFVFSDTVGKGLPMLTPKGATIRRELEQFIVNEELKRGYSHVYTPDIAKVELYEKSGHYPYYKESMYAPIKIEDEEFMLRPMTCPHHFELYLAKMHSYKDMPVRYAELAKLYRFEKSGELSGLQRVRAFTLADAHIIARQDQAKEEINSVLDLIEYIADVFKLESGKDYHYRLSLGNRSDEAKYFKDDEAWETAENTLRTVLKDRKSPFVEAENEAAFYGPKIDIQMRNVNGKEDTAFTVQYDFVMPKRFNLTYINESGKEEQPIVIHRSSIGAIERVMAFLIEHYAGAFPAWLSPVQVAVLPISEKVEGYSRKVYEMLTSSGIRTELDNSNQTVGAKIREATLQKVPYLCIIGGKEESESNSVGKEIVSVRTREGKDLGSIALSEFIERIKNEVEKKI